jgi:hypothetical protein
LGAAVAVHRAAALLSLLGQPIIAALHVVCRFIEQFSRFVAQRSRLSFNAAKLLFKIGV